MDDEVRGSRLVFWGRASGAQHCSPGAGSSGDPWSHKVSPPLQGEAGPPGLPGPPVSVLAVVGEGWPIPVWRGGWA